MVVVALDWVGEVLNEKKPEEMEKKRKKKETLTRAQTTHLALFGPVFVVVAHFPSFLCK